MTWDELVSLLEKRRKLVIKYDKMKKTRGRIPLQQQIEENRNFEQQIKELTEQINSY